MLISAESTNSKTPLLTRRNNISICLSNDYCFDHLEIVNDGFIWLDWLQLEPVVVARDNKCSPPTIHTHPHPIKPAQLHHQHWLRQFISNNCNYDRSIYPNISQRSLRNRHRSLTSMSPISTIRLTLPHKLQQRAHVACSIKFMRTWPIDP